MLVKTGDAEIIGVVDPYEIEDDDQRKLALATALDKAKDKISARETQVDKMES
ncbi:hypothetical protein M0R72_02150 [Candidatus Pacearchaeota archaeon]|jgi:hypothetical protein|nr:hypothetical protein [Candidatus Pacearchaeota archaeon]